MKNEEVIRRGFRVVGRVQGVGFRWWTRRLAERLGVVGWVRNCADGSVECEAKGAADVVEQLRVELERGPTHARVDAVDCAELEVERDGQGFEVRR